MMNDVEFRVFCIHWLKPKMYYLNENLNVRNKLIFIQGGSPRVECRNRKGVPQFRIYFKANTFYGLGFGVFTDWEDIPGKEITDRYIQLEKALAFARSAKFKMRN